MHGFIDNEKKSNTLYKKPNSRQECKSHALFEAKMAKIDTLPMTKGKKKIPFGAAPHVL